MERTAFEKALSDGLRRKFRAKKHIRVEKNLIVAVRSDLGHAVIQCMYVGWARGYHLVANSNSDILSRFLSGSPLPYRSRLPSRYQFCFTTLTNEHRRVAKSLSGHVAIPEAARDVERVCRRIVDAISEVYLPYVENFVSMGQGVVTDVMSSPEFYAFPLATALCAAKRSGLTFSELNFPDLMSRALCGDPAFDEELARRILCGS